MGSGSVQDSWSPSAARGCRGAWRAWISAVLLALTFCALDVPGERAVLGGGPRLAAAQVDNRFPVLERRRRPASDDWRGSGFFPFFNWGQPR
jgi:hypothetical protein